MCLKIQNIIVSINPLLNEKTGVGMIGESPCIFMKRIATKKKK